MKNFVQHFIAALTALIYLTAPGIADDKTTVRVALLDMSSVTGAGMSGMGMMEPGMTGSGMMDPGPMGQGMMGGRMMATGMMGMGMMSIRTDTPSVKARAVSFDVTNWSRSVVHEMLVVAVENPNAALPYNYGEAKLAEDQVKSFGKIADLQPNASGAVDLTLAPGWYLLICNVPDHYAAGMVTQFQVTP